MVAGRPSSIPALASTNAPVQIDTVRVRPALFRSASSASAGNGPAARRPSTPATITVSAQASASSPCSGTTEYPDAERVGAAPTVQTRTS